MALSTDKAVGPPAAAHRLDEVGGRVHSKKYRTSLLLPVDSTNASICMQNKLCTYLRARVPELSELSHISAKQFSHGQSNPTYLLEVSPCKYCFSFS